MLTHLASEYAMLDEQRGISTPLASEHHVRFAKTKTQRTRGVYNLGSYPSPAAHRF